MVPGLIVECSNSRDRAKHVGYLDDAELLGFADREDITLRRIAANHVHYRNVRTRLQDKKGVLRTKISLARERLVEAYGLNDAELRQLAARGVANDNFRPSGVLHITLVDKHTPRNAQQVSRLDAVVIFFAGSEVSIKSPRFLRIGNDDRPLRAARRTCKTRIVRAGIPCGKKSDGEKREKHDEARAEREDDALSYARCSASRTMCLAIAPKTNS